MAEPKDAKLIIPFAENALKKKTYGDNVIWINKEDNEFGVNWRNKNNKKWTSSQSQMFVDWGVITAKKKQHKKDGKTTSNIKRGLKVLKHNFRSALDSKTKGEGAKLIFTGKKDITGEKYLCYKITNNSIDQETHHLPFHPEEVGTPEGYFANNEDSKRKYKERKLMQTRGSKKRANNSPNRKIRSQRKCNLPDQQLSTSKRNDKSGSYRNRRETNTCSKRELNYSTSTRVFPISQDHSAEIDNCFPGIFSKNASNPFTMSSPNDAIQTLEKSGSFRNRSETITCSENKLSNSTSTRVFPSSPDHSANVDNCFLSISSENASYPFTMSIPNNATQTLENPASFRNRSETNTCSTRELSYSTSTRAFPSSPDYSADIDNCFLSIFSENASHPFTMFSSNDETQTLEKSGSFHNRRETTTCSEKKQSYSASTRIFPNLPDHYADVDNSFPSISSENASYPFTMFSSNDATQTLDCNTLSRDSNFVPDNVQSNLNDQYCLQHQETMYTSISQEMLSSTPDQHQPDLPGKNLSLLENQDEMLFLLVENETFLEQILQLEMNLTNN